MRQPHYRFARVSLGQSRVHQLSSHDLHNLTSALLSQVHLPWAFNSTCGVVGTADAFQRVPSPKYLTSALALQPSTEHSVVAACDDCVFELGALLSPGRGGGRSLRLHKIFSQLTFVLWVVFASPSCVT